MREKLTSLISVFLICLCVFSGELAAGAPCPDLTFGAPTYFAGGLQTNGLATGDLNGDGNVDLVAANEGSGTITVRFGDGSGGFPSSLQLFGSTPSSVAIGDFNLDGNLDIVTSHRSLSTITVRLGLGGGAFDLPVQTAVGPSPSGVATGDFNGDGNVDLVTSNAGGTTISLLLGNAGGSFPVATSVFIGRGSGSSGIATADLNGDGNLDVVTANRGSFNLSVLLGNGAGGFVSATVFPTGIEPMNITAGDLNGDSRPDLAVANLGGGITVRLNDGLGGFPTAFTLPAGIEPFSAAIGDLDDDGNRDIVAANRVSNNVSVFRGNGDGTFAPRIDLALNAGPRAVVIADFNDDDSLDIAAGIESSMIGVLLNACSANTGPTISAGIVTRQQDAGASNSTIATVDDDQDEPEELSVTVNGATSSTVNGVTVSNLSIDPSGNVTADVSAACGATDAMFTLAVTDTGGLSSTAKLSVDVLNETTPPVINSGDPLPDVTVYLPLNTPDVSMPVSFELPIATDNCTVSPTVTASPVSGSTFNVGPTLVTVTASDDLGNTSTATFNVHVLFSFGGLLPPVDPFPALNIATAGSSVPVKFSLSGDKGLKIIAAGYPASSVIPCDQNEVGSIIEAEAAGGTVLTYDPGSDSYTYVWKTSKAWQGMCRIFVLRLTDGSEHYAKFRFR